MGYEEASCDIQAQEDLSEWNSYNDHQRIWLTYGSMYLVMQLYVHM